MSNTGISGRDPIRMNLNKEFKFGTRPHVAMDFAINIPFGSIRGGFNIAPSSLLFRKKVRLRFQAKNIRLRSVFCLSFVYHLFAVVRLRRKCYKRSFSVGYSKSEQGLLCSDFLFLKIPPYFIPI